MYNFLIQHSLPILHYPFYTTLPVQPQQQVMIAQKMPTQIGLIYGLSIDTSGVTPTNQPLIQIGQASLLFMTLKQEASDFIYQMRLDNLLFSTLGNYGNAYRFQAVNIPGNIDMDQSYYQNPTSINSGAAIKLNMWYLTWDNLAWCAKNKIIVPSPFNTLKKPN